MKRPKELKTVYVVFQICGEFILPVQTFKTQDEARAEAKWYNSFDRYGGDKLFFFRKFVLDGKRQDKPEVPE
jgi:hypothetical protein